MTPENETTETTESSQPQIEEDPEGQPVPPVEGEGGEKSEVPPQPEEENCKSEQEEDEDWVAGDIPLFEILKMYYQNAEGKILAGPQFQYDLADMPDDDSDIKSYICPHLSRVDWLTENSQFTLCMGSDCALFENCFPEVSSNTVLTQVKRLKLATYTWIAILVAMMILLTAILGAAALN